MSEPGQSTSARHLELLLEIGSTSTILTEYLRAAKLEPNPQLAGGHGAMAGGHLPLAGREPKRLASRFRDRALQRLGVSPETKGKPLL